MSINNKQKAQLASLEKSLTRARDLSIFKPDNAQRQAKSNFWSYFVGSTEMPPESIELATALRYGGDARIEQWWPLSGFQDWFCNKDEFRQKIDYLATIALDEIEAVLTSRTAKAGEIVAAVKLVMEIADKFPNRRSGADQYLDQKVAEMDKKQLEEFIAKRIIQIAPPKGPIDSDN